MLTDLFGNRGGTICVAQVEESSNSGTLFLQFIFEERVKVNHYLFERAFFNSILINIFCQPLGHYPTSSHHSDKTLPQKSKPEETCLYLQISSSISEYPYGCLGKTRVFKLILTCLKNLTWKISLRHFRNVLVVSFKISNELLLLLNWNCSVDLTWTCIFLDVPEDNFPI